MSLAAADSQEHTSRRKLPPSFGLFANASGSAFQTSAADSSPQKQKEHDLQSRDRTNETIFKNVANSTNTDPLLSSSASCSHSSNSGSSGQTGDGAAHRERYEHHMVRMSHVFECFASFGGGLNSTNEMDGTHFVRMLREAGLVDRQLFTAVDADLLFRKIKDKNGRILTPQRFLALGIPEIAARRKLSSEKLSAILYDAAEAFVEVPLTAAETRLSQSYVGGSLRLQESSSVTAPARRKAVRSSSASPTRSDLLYQSMTPTRGITHASFQTTPRPLSRFKHVRSSSVRAQHTNSGWSPPARVRLHDDKSLYTGVHRHGGISCVDRDPSDLASVVDRRKKNDVRGAVA